MILNKEISLNNYTILDIIFPDFQLKNYFNEIIFCDKEISIKHRIQIFLFKYKKEFFNEIVPFNIQFKKLNYIFKFFIAHNLINKINIFINYTNINTCAIEYVFYNAYIVNSIFE